MKNLHIVYNMNEMIHETTTVTRERSEILADAIYKEIVEGRLGPGEKLNEEVIAKRFNVSRGPVREALRRLSERKLVVFSRNAGARVVHYSLENILDLLEVRESLEASAAKLAAERMTFEQKTALRALFESHVVSVNTNQTNSYLQSPEDLDFHYLIAKGAGNPVLINILCEDLYPHLMIFRRQHQHIPGRGKHALEEHRRILMAIEERESQLAELLMRRHIAIASQSLIELLRSSPEELLPS